MAPRGGKDVAGAIVCTPAPGMLKRMVEKSMLLLASLIACRSDPGPESFVFVTVKAPASRGAEAKADARSTIPAAIRTTRIGSHSLFWCGEHYQTGPGALSAEL